MTRGLVRVDPLVVWLKTVGSGDGATSGGRAGTGEEARTVVLCRSSAHAAMTQRRPAALTAMVRPEMLGREERERRE